MLKTIVNSKMKWIKLTHLNLMVAFLRTAVGNGIDYKTKKGKSAQFFVYSSVEIFPITQSNVYQNT